MTNMADKKKPKKGQNEDPFKDMVVSGNTGQGQYSDSPEINNIRKKLLDAGKSEQEIAEALLRLFKNDT